MECKMFGNEVKPDQRIITKLLALGAICLINVLVLGCTEKKKQIDIGKSPQAIVNNGESVSILSYENINSFIDSSTKVPECSSDGEIISCTAKSRIKNEFRGYEFLQSNSVEGDYLRFTVIGSMRGNKNIIIIKALLGHDAPFLIFWNRISGGQICASPNYGDIIFSKNETELIIPSELSKQFKAWELWTDLQGQAKKFDCTTSHSGILVDSALWEIGSQGNNTPIAFKQIISNPRFKCVENKRPFDSELPDFMIPPHK